MTCKICNNPSEKIFDKIILQKYHSNYYQCKNCSFVQTDEPIWLEEAYSNAITTLDIGLLGRNIYLREEISEIIDCCFPNSEKFLDYAGGYGTLTRLMRDAGYNFFNHDDYCENIFANYFEIKDSESSTFDLVTSFEVLEHFNDPLIDIKKIFSYAENAIFSTEIVPENQDEISNWWYISEETGQHIAFYSTKSIEHIAKLNNKHYYCRGGNLHLFTSKKLEDYQIDFAIKKIREKEKRFGFSKKKLSYKIQRESLLMSDYQFIKNKLNSIV